MEGELSADAPAFSGVNHGTQAAGTRASRIRVGRRDAEPVGRRTLGTCAGAKPRLWTLIKECDFLVAMSVDENGIACLADGFSGFLGESAGYEVRQRIARYLDQA
jgi:hypothetical protein